MRLSIIRGSAAITVILATRTTAATRATTGMGGEATIGPGDGIGTTAGTLAKLIDDFRMNLTNLRFAQVKTGSDVG